MLILIVTRRALELSAFGEALAKGTGAQLRITNGWANAKATVKTLAPAFVVLDEGLKGGPPLELARQIIEINAMVNIAVVSPLGEDEFHQASEGLGILAPVPVNPTVADGAALARVFRRFV